MRLRVLPVLIALGTAASCTPEPEIVARPVVVYSPRACPVSASDAFSVVYAAGDFEPGPDRPASAAVFLRELGRTMTALPTATRSVVVDVSERDLAWRGLADVPPAGPVNVLVWPGAESCRLTRDVERRTDEAFAVVGRHVFVAGGRAASGEQVPHTFVGDLSTGAIERLVYGLNTRRLQPSITAFGAPAGANVSGASPPGAALVAGGADPDSNAPMSSAEVYVPKPGAPSDVGDFEPFRIDLSEARARHGAVVLSTGETLLVGGRGTSGVLRTMEIMDPQTRRARTAGVALLAVARQSPTVLRLANGEILVAGGVDASGAAVPTLEWFAPDASRPSKRPVELVTGRERAFVPLEAGGALAVIAPAEGATPDFKTVWVISADGTLEPAAPIDPGTLDRVRLFAGAEGAPILWTGRQWLRWAPWAGAFRVASGAPPTGPTLDAIASGDPGLALWLDDRGAAGLNVTGYRFAARTPFGPVPNPLLVLGPDALAPDRLVGAATSALRFDPARGLVLEAGASVFVSDLSFGDFALDVDISGGAPVIVVRDERGVELEVGGAACAFAQTAMRTLEVVRDASTVSVRVDDAPARACPTSLLDGARVTLGLRGPQVAGTTSARNLRIVRR